MTNGMAHPQIQTRLRTVRNFTSLDALLDDVLLRVLQYVDVEDILALRLTCKRLLALCRLPAVWRHRAIRHDHSYSESFPTERHLLGPVLRTAPCLWRLCLKFPPAEECRELPFDTTRCAVAHLTVVMEGDDILSGDNWTPTVCRLIRNQEALGRLRHLELLLAPLAPVYIKRPHVILATAMRTSRLESLAICGFPTCYELPLFIRRTSVRHPPYRTLWMSPLTSFHCDLQTVDGRLRNLILQKNAATLEEVILTSESTFLVRGDVPDSWILENFPLSGEGTAALLARMPRLATLMCPPLEGIEAVADNKSIRKVSFAMEAEWKRRLAGAAEFLRRATQLREVMIYADTADAVNLVTSLASSGQARVEKLCLEDTCASTSFVSVAPLVSALPRLRNLQELYLDHCVARDELLLAIHPETAPALRRFNICDVRSCPHSWMHKKAVEALVVANPSLHVHLDFPVCGSGYPLCPCCAETSCHPELRSGRPHRVGLYSHARGQCSSPKSHQSASLLVWFRF
ncbi:F-box only protein 36 [Frankliniella fusca]|uniref:F-box only protein 36 n=1 Tax=Frankliniella fusca TaxID=407009 RepID=A0AAE1GPC5_9NEOP|nr:F-box only protein 36 [Frankliniella fusca]